MNGRSDGIVEDAGVAGRSRTVVCEKPWSAYCSRRSMFRYVNAVVRYCETDCGEEVDLLVAEHVR